MPHRTLTIPQFTAPEMLIYVKTGLANALLMAQAGFDAAIPDPSDPSVLMTGSVRTTMTYLFGTGDLGTS